MKGSTTLNRRLRLKAADALQRSPIPALRHLTLVDSREELILDGRLPSDYYRQLAQEVITPFLNGRILINRVVIATRD